MSLALDIANTVPVEELRHRLLLGVALRDAATGGSALPPVTATLESLGHYRLDMPMDAHGAGRHALRYAGLVAPRLRALVKANADTTAWVRIESPTRVHVARRFAFTLVLAGDEPQLVPATANMRTAWLWPGAAYAMPPTTTLLRGRVLEGPDADHAVPVPWARVFATIPVDAAAFDPAAVVGCAHADDRGEYVLAITQDAYAGAALPPTADVHLWAFRAPPVNPPDPTNPFEGLAAEDAGTDAINDVLRGDVVPAGYALFADAKLKLLRVGERRGGPDTTLLSP